MKRLFVFVAFAGTFGAALGQCGEDDAQLIIAPRPAEDNPGLAALGKRLNSPDFAQVEAAAQELALKPDAQALPLFWALYNNGDAARRLLAVRCVGRLGLTGQEDNLFRVAIGDLYHAIRLAAAEELARLETPDRAAERLAKGAEDNGLKALYRWRASQAVAQVRGKVAAECLRKWLNGPQRDLAVAAAEGLARLGDQSQAECLVAALSTSDAELKPAAAEALEELTGQRYRYDLVKWSEWLKKPLAPLPPTPSRGGEGAGGGPPAENSPADSQYEIRFIPRTATEGWWDVVIVFDTTGSMLHVWPALDPPLDAVVSELARQAPGLRLGSVRYRAAVPELSLLYTVKAEPLTRDLPRVRESIKDTSFGGDSGGLHLGLDCAIRTMLWRVAARKMIVLIGDTSPPPEGVRFCARLIREAWRYDGILVNTLYVRSVHGSEHAQAYRGLALAGTGHYFEYDKAEKRIVDRTENEKADARQADSPGLLATKWMMPRK